MDVIISGVITEILPVQQGVSQRSGQPWMSQEYVMCHEQGQYPRYVCFRVFGQDKIQQMNIQKGEALSIHLNVDARQANGGRWFNSLDVWKVERSQGQQQVQQPMQQGQQPFPPQQNAQQFPPQQPAQSPFPPQGNQQSQPMQQQVQQPFPPQQNQQDGQLPF